MEAVFAKHTRDLFSCSGCSAAGQPGSKAFYCPSSPRTINTNNEVSVLTPSNHTPEPRPLVRGEPREQEASCGDWQCEVRRRGRVPGNTQLYHTHTYNESWPTSSCSSQQTPPTSPQAPPTSISQRSSCDEDVSVERALVFEEEEERRPLARLVERFRRAAPSSREERGKERSTPFQLPPPSISSSHSTPQTSHTTTHKTHTHNSPSFTDPSLHVSDSSSLESRSQGLINRGCSLVSPSSTTASSPPANSYFTSKRGDIVASECLTALMNIAAAPTDGLTSATPTTTHTKVSSRCVAGAVSVEEDILYQCRMRRRLEEARREAKSSNKDNTGPYKHILDPGMENGVPGMGTGKVLNSIGTGRVSRTMLAPYPLAGAAVAEHGEREKLIGTLTDLGVVGSGNCSEGHGGVKSPPTSSSSTASSSSSPRLDEKEEVAGRDFNSHTCTAEEEQHTSPDNQHQTTTNTENLTPGPLNQQQGEEEGPGGCKSQKSIPPSSKEPEDGSSSSNVEREPKTAPANQRMISESTLTIELNQPTTVGQTHTLSLHGDGYHGNDGLDLEGSVGVEESSYWTISPCGSPDSAQTPHPSSLGPLINKVVGDRLFDHHSSATPTPLKAPHPATPDSDSSAVCCRRPSWNHDMNDDLLRLLIGQARCFEAGIRRIDDLLEQLESDTTDIR